MFRQISMSLIIIIIIIEKKINDCKIYFKFDKKFYFSTAEVCNKLYYSLEKKTRLKFGV